MDSPWVEGEQVVEVAKVAVEFVDSMPDRRVQTPKEQQTYDAALDFLKQVFERHTTETPRRSEAANGRKHGPL